MDRLSVLNEKLKERELARNPLYSMASKPERSNYVEYNEFSSPEFKEKARASFDKEYGKGASESLKTKPSDLVMRRQQKGNIDSDVINVEGLLEGRSTEKPTTDYIPEVYDDVSVKTKSFDESAYKKAIDDVKSNYKKDDDEDSTLIDLLTMAVPVVVGGAMGHSNVGAGVGAEYGQRRLDEDKSERKSLKDALNKIAMKRAELASENELKTQSDLNKVGTYIVDGKLVPLTHRQAIQMKAQPAEKGFYSQNSRGSVLNTVTGDQRNASGSNLTPQEEMAKKKFDLDNEKFIYNQIKDRLYNPKQGMEDLALIRDADRLLAKNPEQTFGSLQRSISRIMSKEGKVMSDQDAKAMGYDAGFADYVNRVAQKIRDGRSAESIDVKELRAILPALYNQTKKFHIESLNRNKNLRSENNVRNINESEFYNIQEFVPEKSKLEQERSENMKRLMEKYK